MNKTEGLDDEKTSRVPLKLSLSIAYIALFLVGTIGNGIVSVMIINVLTSMHRMTSYGRRKSISATKHVFVYVLGLSIVDLLVILHLPFLVVDLLKGEWLFGVATCKLYWFGESVNKLLSSFIMTVLSWDRYLAVCSPIKSIRMRSNGVAVLVLITCSLLAIVLLLPVLIEATVFKIDKIKMITLLEGSKELQLSDEQGTTMKKCMFDADAMFTLYTFVIGFALPALLITIFYSKVIYRLQKSSLNIRQCAEGRRKDSSHRSRQVTKRIITVILFYFLCWTPQWTLNIMSQFNLIQVSWMTPALSAMFFVAHLLVCFNSAANPVLYALINRELRQQHLHAMQAKRQSVSNATQGAIEISREHRTSTASAYHITINHRRASCWMRAKTFMMSITSTLTSFVGWKTNDRIPPSHRSSLQDDNMLSSKEEDLTLPSHLLTSSINDDFL